MFHNYLKVAFRHLRRQKLYSAINIIGLAVGTASFILLSLFVLDEVSYDEFHSDSDLLFRIQTNLELNGILYDEASIAFPAAEALKSDFPEITETFRLYKADDPPLLQVGDQLYTEKRFFFADPEIFQLFSYDFAAGNPKNVLSDINSLVITQEMAIKYFGNKNPLGQVITYQGDHALKVSGVIAEVPTNTHLKFDFIAPLELQMSFWESVSGNEGREKKWFWTGAWTYLKLADKTQLAELEQKFPRFVDQYFPERIKGGVTLGIQPVKDIHLHSNLNYEIEPNSHVLYLYIFSAIGLAILLIACFNFTNLATALSMKRIKEIGMRKALGAFKSQLFMQILVEILISSLIGVGLAIILTDLSLPVFNELTGKQLETGILLEPIYLAAILLLVILISLVAGLYPALVASRFSVINMLKGQTKVGGRPATLQKILVVLQFAASVILMIGIGVIYQQLDYLNGKELGFNKENLLVITARNRVNKQFDTFREELLQHPDILNLSGVSNLPGRGTGAWRFVPEDGSFDKPVMLPLTFVDYEFLNTTQAEVLAGRFLSQSFPADMDQAFVLNEKAAQMLGWENDPVGKKLELFGPGINEIIMSGKVIGVVKDYHFESLHHEIKPLVMAYYPEHSYYLARVEMGDLEGLSQFLDAKWQTFSPDWPLEFKFLDDDLNQLYANEQQLSKTINYFAILAMLIACFGLFALGSFTIAKRVKEIGIRKVLGASLGNIFVLVIKDFVVLIAIAVLIAWPIAYLAMQKWLGNFAYQIDLNFQIFILSGIGALLIGIITISHHALKVANTDPVRSLKSE